MSSPQYQRKTARRTSQRRKLKLLKNINQYRIVNPFKLDRSLPVPDELFRQLRRIQFLSSSAITQLCFGKQVEENHCEEAMLAKMHEAIDLQQARFGALMGTPITTCNLFLQDYREVEQQAELCLAAEGEKVAQTKDQISRNIYEPRDPRKEEEFACNCLLIPEAEVPILKIGGAGENGGPTPIIIQQEYENYFVS